MSQYINLLGPAFRKPRVLLTLGRALLLTGIAGAAMAGVYAHDQHRVEGLREELASAQTLLKAQNAYTENLKGDKGKTASSVLDNEVQRLEAQLKSARDSMAVLESGALGNRDGFARYLQAFARQSLDGLWLTGFTVGGSGEVSIQGRVLRPELVPAYIQRLNGEPALKGREFAALELRRPPPVTDAAVTATRDAQSGAAQPAAAQPAALQPVEKTPRYLEFALATTEAAPVRADKGGEKR